jgi:uncharacterized repeat protein (TIGR03803 family)
MQMSARPIEQLASLVAVLVSCAVSPLVHAGGNPAAITTQPSGQTDGVGATVYFLVIASGDPTLYYQWSFDHTNIAGATSQLLIIPNVQTSNQGSYQVVVTNNSGSSTSRVAVLGVVLTPAVVGDSASTSLAVGSTATFSVFTTGQPPLTFQWDFDGAAIAGATSSTLTIANVQLSNSGSYQAFVTNASGHASSSVLPLTVTEAPVISGTTTSGPAVPGGTATFDAFVQGSAPLSYQWYFEAASGASTNAILNATNSVLIVSNVQTANAGSYQLIVTNGYGSAQSQPLLLELVLGTAPVIGGQPSSQTAPQGFLATFQVSASGTAPLYYQWFWNGGPIVSATNPVFSLLKAQSGNAGSYQVVVTNAFGAQTSAVATLSVPVVATQAAGITLAPLLSFEAGATGSQPGSRVVRGSDGYLYVTAAQGGVNDVSAGGDGTICKMDTNGNVLWTVSLTQAGGANPAAGLLEGGGGVFYGTTVNGGAGYGTVFSITSGGVFTSLYSFTNGLDGANPRATLVLGRDGGLYGCAAMGGTNDAASGGDGTIFKMSTNGALVWAVSLDALHGRQPEYGLVQSSNGLLYGTTTAGGANAISGGGLGTVFSITTNGVFASVYSFAGGAEGSYPQGSLAVGPDGGLYGTTTAGGNLALNSGLGCGTFFDITTNGLLTTLAFFDGTNGDSPQGALALGGDDNFYGTTTRGGVTFPGGYGTIFRVTINGGITSLLSFDGGSDGAYPTAGLTQGNPGVFYGTTSEGGTNDLSNGGDGSVFEFTSLAGPPALANPGSQVLQIGQELVFTNESFGGTLPITLSLASNDLSGANLSTNGVFSLAPDCQEGSTTNVISIWATDSSTPPLSNAMSFTVVVGPCAEVSVGSGPVQIGQSLCLPVSLFATSPLTNLSFAIQTLTNRFTNWSINPVNGAIAQATVADPVTSQPQFNFTAKAGKSFSGSSLLGYVCVEVLDSGHSAFALLVVSNIVALAPSDPSPVPAFGVDGEAILIEGKPLLSGMLAISVLADGTTPQLTLYGNPGTNYSIQYTTNLLPPVVWTTFTNFTLSGLTTNFYQVSPTDQMEFFRAFFPRPSSP